MRSPVLVAGALHLDVIVNARRLPRKDETLTGERVAYRFGGKGGNQAVAAARMGARVEMAGRVGSDDFGQRLLSALDDAGVGRRQVNTSQGASGMSVAIVDEWGEYGAVIVSGVNGDILPGDIQVPAEVDLLLLQCEIPEEVNAALISEASEHCRVLLNAAPARPVSADILARVDILVVNRVEAAAIAELMENAFDPELAARRLGKLGPRAVVVTLGKSGALVLGSDGKPRLLPAHEVKVVSTHGAGDAFIGALAAELARGATLREAVTFAQAAAALTVSADVTGRKMLTEGLVREFLSCRGNRA